jgi:hypothetical protein
VIEASSATIATAAWKEIRNMAVPRRIDVDTPCHQFENLTISSINIRRDPVTFYAEGPRAKQLWISALSRQCPKRRLRA